MDIDNSDNYVLENISSLKKTDENFELYKELLNQVTSTAEKKQQYMRKFIRELHSCVYSIVYMIDQGNEPCIFNYISLLLATIPELINAEYRDNLTYFEYVLESANTAREKLIQNNLDRIAQCFVLNAKVCNTPLRTLKYASPEEALQKTKRIAVQAYLEKDMEITIVVVTPSDHEGNSSIDSSTMEIVNNDQLALPIQPSTNTALASINNGPLQQTPIAIVRTQSHTSSGDTNPEDNPQWLPWLFNHWSKLPMWQRCGLMCFVIINLSDLFFIYNDWGGNSNSIVHNVYSKISKQLNLPDYRFFARFFCFTFGIRPFILAEFIRLNGMQPSMLAKFMHFTWKQ